MSIVSELLAEIESFVALRGMSPTEFGLASVNDGHLVRKLRTGQRDIKASRIDAIRDWMHGFAIANVHGQLPDGTSAQCRSGYTAGKEWGSTCSPAPRRRTSRRCAA